MVDLDLRALQAHGLTPQDVTNAVTAQNLTTTSGLAKMGAEQYVVRLNSTPDAVAALNRIPIKVVTARQSYCRTSPTFGMVLHHNRT